MAFVIFSDISMNRVLFDKMDQVFIQKKKTKDLNNAGKMDKNTGKFTEPCESSSQIDYKTVAGHMTRKSKLFHR